MIDAQKEPSFHLAGDGLEDFYKYASTVPESDRALYDAILLDHDATRNKKQNKLMWAWNNDAAKAQSTSPNWQHGEWKLQLLLPMMKGWQEHHSRAMAIQELLDDLSTYRQRVFYSFDSIRSSDLKVKQFAEALTTYQQHYAEQGIVLESNSDLAREAMMINNRMAA